MKCPKCKKEFKLGRSDQVYCSRKCQQANKTLRKKNAENEKYGSLCFRFREIILSCFDNECKICGSNHKLNIHHIIPLALGGKNNINNVVPLCEKCHQSIHKNLL